MCVVGGAFYVRSALFGFTNGLTTSKEEANEHQVARDKNGKMEKGAKVGRE